MAILNILFWWTVWFVKNWMINFYNRGFLLYFWWKRKKGANFCYSNFMERYQWEQHGFLCGWIKWFQSGRKGTGKRSGCPTMPEFILMWKERMKGYKCDWQMAEDSRIEHELKKKRKKQIVIQNWSWRVCVKIILVSEKDQTWANMWILDHDTMPS